MSRIMVTGGAGFIGSHCAEALWKQGHEIMIIDNYSTGDPSNLPVELIPEHISNISLPNDFASIMDYFRPEIIIHAAASYANPSNWGSDALTNCFGTAVICELAKAMKVQKIIYFQTSLCYGLNPLSPVHIDHPVNPAPNSYAITKTYAEQLIAMSGVPFVSLRLANIYGPRNLTGAIPAFFKKINAGATSIIYNTRRDFVYIDDLVNLVVRIVDGQGEQNCYHVSTGRDYSMLEIHELMLDLMNAADKFPGFSQIGIMKDKKPEDAATILLDNSETLKDFPGWGPRTVLAPRLKEAIKWYQEHPGRMREVFTHLNTEK